MFIVTASRRYRTPANAHSAFACSLALYGHLNAESVECAPVRCLALAPNHPGPGFLRKSWSIAWSIAEVAELVDALASGASELLARGGSSPLLGTRFSLKIWLHS